MDCAVFDVIMFAGVIQIVPVLFLLDNVMFELM